jgi:hypothetical protein
MRIKKFRFIALFIAGLLFFTGCNTSKLTSVSSKTIVSASAIQNKVESVITSSDEKRSCLDTNNGVGFYLTSHGYLRNWPKLNLTKAVSILHNIAGDFTTVKISSVYRGSTVTEGNELFPQDKSVINRDIFGEIYSSNPKMRRVAFLESGLTIAYNSRLLKDHPTWFMKNYDGSYVFRTDGVNTLQLNFLNPEVMKHIADIVVKLAKNKYVDGLEIDDHFAIWPNNGYSQEMLVAFYKQNKSYRVGMSESQIWKNRPKPNDSKWLEFKTDQLTSLAARLVKKVVKVGSCAKVSIMTNSPEFMKARGQDPLAYDKSDVGMSEVGFQIYSRNSKGFQDSLAPMIASSKNSTYALLLGLGKGDTVPIDVLAKKIALVSKVRKISFFGISNLMPDGQKLGLPKGETPELRAKSLKKALDKWQKH